MAKIQKGTEIHEKLTKTNTKIVDGFLLLLPFLLTYLMMGQLFDGMMGVALFRRPKNALIPGS